MYSINILAQCFFAYTRIKPPFCRTIKRLREIQHLTGTHLPHFAAGECRQKGVPHEPPMIVLYVRQGMTELALGARKLLLLTKSRLSEV